MVDFFVAISGRFLALFFPVFHEQNRGYIISPLDFFVSYREKNPSFSPRITHESRTLQYHRPIALLALSQASSAQGIVVLPPGIGIQKEVPLQLRLLRHSRHTVTSSHAKFFHVLVLLSLSYKTTSASKKWGQLSNIKIGIKITPINFRQ